MKSQRTALQPAVRSPCTRQWATRGARVSGNARKVPHLQRGTASPADQTATRMVALVRQAFRHRDAWWTRESRGAMKPLSPGSRPGNVVWRLLLAASATLSLLTLGHGQYTTLAGPRIKWAIAPVEYRESSTYLPYTVNHSPLGPPDGFPPEVLTLAPYTKYLLRVRLEEISSGRPLYNVTAEYSYIGGYPDVRFGRDSTLDISAIHQNWKTDVPLGVREWYVPFSTSAPGLLFLFVTTNRFITRTIVDNRLQDLAEVLYVPWAASATGKALFGRYQVPNVVPPPPVGAKVFIPRFVPGLSTGWFGFYDVPQKNLTASGQESVVLFTESQWKNAGSTAITIQDLPLRGLMNRCEQGNLPGHLILDGIIVDNCLFLHTLGGIVLQCVNKTDPSSMLFSNPLPYCIGRFSVTTQTPPFNRTDCSALFAIGESTDTGKTDVSGRIWMKTVIMDSFLELLDSASMPLYAAMNATVSSSTVLSAIMSPVSCDSVQVLVKDTRSSRYSVVQFSLSRRQWSATFVFPKNVPNICPDSTSRSVPVYSETEIASQGAEVRELELSSMHFHRTMGRDMYLYGNALFFSPNDALSMYLIHTFPGNTNITTFTSAKDGGFAFMTTDGLVYYGQLGVSRIVPVTNYLDMSTIPGLRFDDLEELNLYTVAVENSTRNTYVKREIIDVQSMLDYAEYVDQKRCPYRHIMYIAPNLVHFTRSFKDATNDLPSDLFLDRGDVYNFSVILAPSDWLEDLTALNVYFMLSNNGVVDVEYNRTETDGNVRYDVSLRDLGSITPQHASGEGGIPSQLRLIPANSSFDCLNYKRKTSIKSETVNVMNIYSGCPPRIGLKFVPSSNMFTGCISPESDVPCIYYESLFQPEFEIADLVAGNATVYLGKYQMQVVGAGPSRDEVTMFSEQEITANNPSSFGLGSSPIWASVADGVTHMDKTGSPIMSLDMNDITWVCAPGSPCYRVYPHRHSQPEYYLLLEVTINAVSINTTYCGLSTRFLIRLYGMPLDVIMSLLITFITAAVSLFLLIAQGYYRWWRNPPSTAAVPMEMLFAPTPGKGVEGRKVSKAPTLQHALSGLSGVVRSATFTDRPPDERSADAKSETDFRSLAGSRSVISSSVMVAEDTGRSPLRRY